MKSLIFLTLMICTLSIYGQNPITQNNTNPELERIAEDLARKYDKELAMQEKQLVLFENKLVEYMIEEQKVRTSNLDTKEKVNILKYNYKAETLDMADILTRTQLDLYKKIKPELQPVEPVVVGQLSSSDD